MSRLDLSSFSPDESSDDSNHSNDEDSSDDDQYGFGCSRHQTIQKKGKYSPQENDNNDDDWSRCIIHLDVDCFYCQCEEIDGPPDYKNRPIAIGQKHIIVTCNYIARKEYGIKKLESRVEAKRKCPNLLIIEGSDLERYRQHSRAIYMVFRNELETIKNELSTLHDVSNNNLDIIPACKGGFDECFADLTHAVRAIQRGDGRNNRTTATALSPHTYVFGDDSSSKVSVTEDQSGHEAVISYQQEASPWLIGSNSEFGRNNVEREACTERLHITSILAARLKRTVREQTGFTVTIGVSISPMLAKLTSDLKKPNSLNILYPWRSSSIILPMPLRKILDLGYRTLKNLQECLKQEHPQKDGAFWTCRDLLQVPRNSILSCLARMQAFEKSSSEQCDLILQRCRGIDPSTIIDDNGGIAKTVSVENSFRRGTILSKEAVCDAIKDLFVRLLRLLDERKSNSDHPQYSFPKTIRVTARVVDYKIQKKRPFVTSSKQRDFNGKRLMTESDTCARSEMIRHAVTPLLECMIFQRNEINVTRINIAMTNFVDLKMESTTTTSIKTVPRSQRDCSIAELLSSQSPGFSSSPKQDDPTDTQKPAALKFDNHDRQDERERSIENHQHTVCSLSEEKNDRTKNDGQEKLSELQCPKGIDPTVLAELPPDIAAEVCQASLSQQRHRTKKRRNKTIEHFFKSKK